VKRRKYQYMNARHAMEQLPFVVETCGGMGPSAVKLLKAMARAAQEQLSMWPKWDIIRHVVGSVAVFVCYLVSDGWDVSTAIQIRLCTGLLSVLPLNVLGCHCMRTEL